VGEEGRLNPFANDVCPGPLGVDVEATAAGLNADVLDTLVESVESRSGGPLMLLTAPRSGYGKTHLLGRVVAAAGGQAVMVPLAFKSGDALTLATITRRGIEALSLSSGSFESPDSPLRWSRLREVCAGVVLHLVRGLVGSGELPCANRAQALQVLEGPVREIFDLEGSARVIGDWLQRQRESLRPPLAQMAAQEVPVRAELLDAWLDAMLEQADQGGIAGLAVMQELAAADTDTGTPSWLRLIGGWRPVVLLVDHLDGFYRNPQAGVTIAALLMDLVDSHGVHVLLSLNQDVWQATFGHHLPSALEDRLTACQVLLRGLDEGDARDMLRLRLEQAGVEAGQAAEFEAFVNLGRHFLGRPVGSVSARAFLRHCARHWQIFHSAPAGATGVPSQIDQSDQFPPAGVAPSASDDDGVIPLMTETLLLEAGEEVPPTFDDATVLEMRQMAEVLAEPKPALPQETMTHVPAPASLPTDALVKTAPAVAPSADAFVKLREMLSRLRQPGAVPAKPPAEAVTAPAKTWQNGVSTPVTQKLAGVMQPDALQGRFAALRLQMSTEAQTWPLDYTKLADLIRLAGRRFPLVRYSEHELPGMTGRFVLYWSLHGMDILFGLANFADESYWRTLSAFAAGRQSDLTTQAHQEGQATPSRLKLVTFKTDREQMAWQVLLTGDVVPKPLRELVDAVHLDTDSVAALYAMQRIIKEAETGAFQAEPAQVMAVLARELDFFWKRVTRVG